MKKNWLLIYFFSSLGFINSHGQDGLVGYWSFDSLAGNQFIDLSGQGNHGFVFGSNLVSGIQDNAFHFDGQNDYAMIGDTDTLPELFRDLGEGTISLWFKVDFIPRFNGIAPLFYYGGRAQCDFFDAANQGLILEVGHSPIHFESERLYFTIWKNGCTYPSFCFDSSDPIKKGHWYRTVQHLRGTIDELRIYDRALGKEEIEGYVIIGPAGRILRSVRTTNKTGTIPLEGLSPGMYNLGFRTADQTIYHELIILI